MPGPVSSWSHAEKVGEAILRSRRHLPASTAHLVDALVSPQNLAIVTGTVVLWAGSHLFGVGEIVDVALLLIGSFMIGASIVDVARLLMEFASTAVAAHSEQDLDRAAKAFASAVVLGGFDVLMALLLRRSARGVQASRGARVSAAAKPAEPGLVEIAEADSQAANSWRTHSVKGDPKMAPGFGSTNPWGDVTYSTAGNPTEVQLVRIHELVHSFLSPRLRLLRSFRVRLALSGYARSVLLRYLEEALAEGVAQTALHGMRGVLTGIRFPVANGYMTLQALLCEGAELGTIVVGTYRFSVQFLPDAPAPVHASGH